MQIGPNQTLIYLVRHGETAFNAERRFQGQLDVPLNEQGVAQARAAAAWLKGRECFSTIYSSDLRRAFETASIIGDQLHLQPQPVEAIREIDVGEWQGLVSSEIEEKYPGQLKLWREQAHLFTVPGGESIAAVQRRVLEWYLDAIEEHRGEAIVVVSHGQALSTLVCALNGWDLTDSALHSRSRHGNTGVSILLADHASGQTTALLLNSLRHLDESVVPSLMDSAASPAV